MCYGKEKYYQKAYMNVENTQTEDIETICGRHSSGGRERQRLTKDCIYNL